MGSNTERSFGDETLDHDDLLFWKFRGLKFRVLILGRANAGKTTILERLAGASIEEAEVRRHGEILTGQVRRACIFAILSSNQVDL